MFSAAEHHTYGKRGYAPTLGLYLAKQWATLLFFTLAGLSLFMALMGSLEALRMAAGKPVTPSEAVLMTMLKIPDLLVQLWPFAVLIATLVWLNGLSARSELVAIKATGLAVRRFLFAPLFTCVLLSVLVVSVASPVAATLLKRYQTWESRIIPPDTRGVLMPSGSLWLRTVLVPQKGIAVSETQSLFLYGANVAQQGTELISATAFMFDASNSLVLRLDADKAELQNGAWRLQNTTVWRPGQPPVPEEAVSIPTTLTPAELLASLNPADTLNAWELYTLTRVLAANGWPSNEHRLMLANLLVLPLLAMAMMVLAVPFGLRNSRTRSVFVSVGLGLGLGFGFFALRNWVGAYAIAGRLEPAMAASVPVAIGLILALFLLVWLREE